MALRVCILAEASPFTWVPHFVRAFRSRCDVITIGPTPDDEALTRWNLQTKKDLITKNDITVNLDNITDLHNLLPNNWIPDLVVAISSNSVEAFRNTANLPCPSVFLSIDTWQCLQDYEHAPYYDHTFVAQREFVPHLRDVGSSNVSWLPLACDPQVHRPLTTPITADLALVGSTNALVHNTRAHLLKALRKHFSVHVTQAAYGDDYCRAYACAKIAFNKSGVNELNMRVFETLAMGRLLLTDHLPEDAGLQELFQDGHHLVTYTDEADLLDKAAYYLDHDKERETIAWAGQDEVLQKHTYQHRVNKIIETVRESCPTFAAETPIHSNQPRDELLDILPKTTRILVDIGLSLSASKYQLRNQGVRQFIGIETEKHPKKSRHARYDAIVPWHNELDSSIDTIVLNDIAVLQGELNETLQYAWKLLVPGGTLLIAINKQELKNENLAPDQDKISEWFRALNFHLTHGMIFKSGRCIFRARKRTRRLRGILAKLSKKYPIEETAYAKGYLEKLPENL